MRKALVVGIDYYEPREVSDLYGCVDDAHRVKAVLERHGDGTVNFDVNLLTGTGPTDTVTRANLRGAVTDLFSGDPDVALFYFAGHGHIEATGGYLIASDSRAGNDGLPLIDVQTLSNQSGAKNKIIILDSCHSGIAGSPPTAAALAELKEGTTILTASTAEQYATEQNGQGVFTNLFVDALNGAGANLVGKITPGSIYAHIDQSLGSWEQRPVFKTNVKSFVSLRDVQPVIELKDLSRIVEFFPQPGTEFQLDPSFEPERGDPPDPNIPPPDPVNTEKFAILQKFNRVNLVVPVDAPHMFHAAMQSKTCKLTLLGEHYLRLKRKGRI